MCIAYEAVDTANTQRGFQGLASLHCKVYALVQQTNAWTSVI